MNEVAAPRERQRPARLPPERVAYWYFRLNGFLQIENFVVHPGHHGGQRTDADLIGVRFPYRAERLIDDPDDLMLDDMELLQLSADQVDIVIAEIKTGRCALNGPWTDEERQNIHRVLAAIGSLPAGQIEAAANALYANGLFDDPKYPRVRLILVGREPSTEIAEKYVSITQVTWKTVLSFIWQRFDQYKRQKTQVDQWDEVGRQLQKLARREGEEGFIAKVCEMMSVRTDEPRPAK